MIGIGTMARLAGHAVAPGGALGTEFQPVEFRQ
jgi:hypothetical protein